MPDRPVIPYQPRPRTRTWTGVLLGVWSRWRSRFTRENVISNLKTIAWVIPLTLLIWIYAEREQIAAPKDELVPFELVDHSADQVVMLISPADKNLMLDLQGPQARLQDVLARLRGGSMPQGLRIDLPSNLGLSDNLTLPSLPLVRQQHIFADNGITVVACQPTQFRVKIDQLVDREAKIVVPPEMKNVSATFDPPTVRIRGPVSDLTRAERNSPTGAVTVLGDLHAVSATPGTYHLNDVPLRRPPDLDVEHVSILSSTRVRATIEVRQADQTRVIRAMPISINGADTVQNKYQVIWVHPTSGSLQNVTVSGPPDIIDRLESPEYPTKPQARLDITLQDAVGGADLVRSKQVKYDLPDGVKVSAEDKARTVEFKLVDRSNLTASQ